MSDSASSSDDLTSALRPLGLSQETEQAYAHILQQPGTNYAKLARHLATETDHVRHCLDQLRGLGLVMLSGDGAERIFPTDPEASLGAILGSRQRELDEARSRMSAVQTLFEDSRPTADANQFVEVVSDPDAVARRIVQLQNSAKTQVLVFDKGPYVVQGSAVHDEELEQLRRGVDVRVVYEISVLQDEKWAALVRRMRESGEKARVSQSLPGKLMIIDRRIAIVPLGRGPRGSQGIVVLSAEPIVNMLRELFESTWREASPLGLPGAPKPEALATEDAAVLVMTAAGLTDDAISRQLGVSRRTVQRRLRSVMESLGVSSRTQLAVRAAHLGLINERGTGGDA